MLSACVWTCRCSCSLFRLKNCWNWLSSICSPSVPCLFPVPQWWSRALKTFSSRAGYEAVCILQHRLSSARLSSDSLDISLLLLFKVLQSQTESRPDPDLLSDSSFTSAVSEGLVQTLFHYSRSNMVSFSPNCSLSHQTAHNDQSFSNKWSLLSIVTLQHLIGPEHQVTAVWTWDNRAPHEHQIQNKLPPVSQRWSFVMVTTTRRSWELKKLLWLKYVASLRCCLTLTKLLGLYLSIDQSAFFIYKWLFSYRPLKISCQSTSVCKC